MREGHARAQALVIACYLILMFFGYWYFLGSFAELLGDDVGFFRAQIVYTLLMGLLSTIGGFVLFDRRAEI